MEDKVFYYIYIYCGLSDVSVGFGARSLKIVSATGSRLDTASDLLFYTMMMIKVWDYLVKGLPQHIWYLIYLILFFRLISYTYVFLKHNKLSSRHTISNKATGFLMFMLPFVVKTQYLVPYSYLVLALAYIAEIEEFVFLIKEHRYE